MAGPVRVWERLRRSHITDFNLSYPRTYLAFGPGRSAEDAVWHQAVKAEVAHHDDKVTGVSSGMPRNTMSRLISSSSDNGPWIMGSIVR